MTGVQTCALPIWLAAVKFNVKSLIQSAERETCLLSINWYLSIAPPVLGLYQKVEPVGVLTVSRKLLRSKVS